MNNEFIVVTERDTESKVILSINTIMSIVETEDGKSFVETGSDKNGNPTGIFTNDTYYDILTLLSKKILVN